MGREGQQQPPKERRRSRSLYDPTLAGATGDAVAVVVPTSSTNNHNPHSRRSSRRSSHSSSGSGSGGNNNNNSHSASADPHWAAHEVIQELPEDYPQHLHLQQQQHGASLPSLCNSSTTSFTSSHSRGNHHNNHNSANSLNYHGNDSWQNYDTAAAAAAASGNGHSVVVAATAARHHASLYGIESADEYAMKNEEVSPDDPWQYDDHMVDENLEDGLVVVTSTHKNNHNNLEESVHVIPLDGTMVAKKRNQKQILFLLSVAMMILLVGIVAVIAGGRKRRQRASPAQQQQQQQQSYVLPPPSNTLASVCTRDSITTASGKRACEEQCEVAECCSLSAEFAMSCAADNDSTCQAYATYCSILQDDSESTSDTSSSTTDTSGAASDNNGNNNATDAGTADAAAAGGAAPPSSTSTTELEQACAAGNTRSVSKCLKLCLAGSCCRAAAASQDSCAARGLTVACELYSACDSLYHG